MNTNLLETAPAAKTWNPKAACLAVLSLVFLCGVAAGALGIDRLHDNRGRVPAFDTPAGKAAYFAHIQKELNLTPAQSEQMESVLNDFWQYYRTVLSDSKQRVEQILDEQQRQKFERLLQQQQAR
jgi:hypothetical protein